MQMWNRCDRVSERFEKMLDYGIANDDTLRSFFQGCQTIGQSALEDPDLRVVYEILGQCKVR